LDFFIIASFRTFTLRPFLDDLLPDMPSKVGVLNRAVEKKSKKIARQPWAHEVLWRPWGLQEALGVSERALGEHVATLKGLQYTEFSIHRTSGRYVIWVRVVSGIAS
jgi:hypothetical protein